MTAPERAPFVSLVFPGSPAIDPDAIEGLRLLEDEDEPNVVGELVDLFLKNAPPRLTAMADAVAAGDRSALSRVAHSLKSSSANLGALGMSHVCERLERMKEPSVQEDAGALVSLLNQEYEVVIRALTAIAQKS
jgi:two-component system, sensor histidine kinase and response regulator